jgi:hypothetical protein
MAETPARYCGLSTVRRLSDGPGNILLPSGDRSPTRRSARESLSSPRRVHQASPSCLSLDPRAASVLVQ